MYARLAAVSRSSSCDSRVLLSASWLAMNCVVSCARVSWRFEVSSTKTWAMRAVIRCAASGVAST